jgi:hypothetical protein
MGPGSCSNGDTEYRAPETHMKIIALAVTVGTLAAVAAPAFAEENGNYPYDPAAVQRQQQLEQRYGPYAVPQDRAHLSAPGNRPWYEEPSTLTPDSSRFGYGYGSNAYGYRRDERVSRRWDNTECWNPRARHYEAVRPGERQDDLDFNRCRRER